MRRRAIVGVVAALALVLAAVAYAAKPVLVGQPTPQAVVSEHVDALNKCSVPRLMAQYPETVHIILPDLGQAVGRAQVRALFNGFCKPPKIQASPDGGYTNAGGLKGLQFRAIKTWIVGGTVNARWKATSCFTKDYYGADAYETGGGLMAAQVTTFDGSKLVFRPCK